MSKKQVGLDVALANRLQHAATTEGIGLAEYSIASSLWLLKQAEVIVPRLVRLRQAGKKK